MRKIILAAATLFTFFKVSAQDVGVELYGMAGYQMGASTATYLFGDFKYKPSDSYQFGLSFPVEDLVEVELSYNFSSSYCNFDYWSTNNDLPFFNNRADAFYSFYQLGFLRGVDLSDKLHVYGLFSVGASHLRFTDKSQIRPGYGTDDVLRFAFTVGLGAKIYVTDRVGLRIQGKLNAPVSGVGFGVSCGSGGCGSGVSTVSFFVQGEVQGGVFLVLKKPGGGMGSKSIPQNSSAGLW